MSKWRCLCPSNLAPLVPACCLLGTMALLAQSQSHKNFDLVKISENVYAAVAAPSGDAVSNSGFVITDRWVCVFDSHLTADAARELIGEIRKVTSLPIRYLINSHFHGDHTHGNQAFPADTEVIATHATWQNLLNKDLPQLQRYQQVLPDQIGGLKRDLKAATSAQRAEEIRQELLQREEFLDRIRDLELVLPGLTFDRTLSLRTLNKDVQVLFLGRGHTDGDATLWLAEEKILFAGDLVFHQALPNMNDGYSKDWIETLGLMGKMKAEVIIPGHGPVGDDTMLAEFRDYLQDLRKNIKANMEKGQTLEDMLKNMTVPSKYKEFQFQQFFPGNVEKIYREYLEEAASQKPPGL